MNKIPELLAPAANLACAITAFKYGADAVYAGLTKFNARERTENFSIDDMSKLIAYSRKNNKKVYVTLNTLIKENELSEVMEILAELAFLQPNAVIVQDLGVLHLIKTYFPQLTIHASTQMAIHNSAGVNYAESLGIERVILERQVTINELEKITRKSSLELEIFIHGALCCSLSTSCLLSSWVGGWSGNRGKCKQPCRHRFYNAKGNGFFFSTSDLYTLEHIETFKKLGIASLKIEGRLKQQDYIKYTVSAYRMMLDAPLGQEKMVLKEAKHTLSKSLGRKWSNGFYSKADLKTVVQYNSMGASGLLCGKVLKILDNGFVISPFKRIHIGDKIRIQSQSGEEGPVITVTKITLRKRVVKKLTKNDNGVIHCDKEIPKDGLVFKIGESVDNLSSFIEKLPKNLFAVNIKVLIKQDAIDIQTTNTPSKIQKSYEQAFELAKKHPPASKNIEEQFLGFSNEIFEAGKIEVKIGKNLFIPASVIKKIRNDFWSLVSEKIDNTYLKESSLVALQNFYDDYNKSNKKEHYKVTKTVLGTKSNAVIASTINDYDKHTKEIILPAFCSEYDLGSLEFKIKKAYKGGIRKFRVRSLFELKLLDQYSDINIIIAQPFPVSNSMTIAFAKNINIKRVQAWLELDKSALMSLIEKSSLPIEVYKYGRPAIFATRAKIEVNGDIRDSRGNAFIVKEEEKENMTYIYPQKVLSFPSISKISEFWDYSNTQRTEDETSMFNHKLEWM